MDNNIQEPSENDNIEEIQVGQIDNSSLIKESSPEGSPKFTEEIGRESIPNLSKINSSESEFIGRNVSLVSENYTTSNEGKSGNDFDPMIKNPTTLPLRTFLSKTSQIAFPGMFFYLSLLLLQTINLAFIGQKYSDDNMINAIGVTNLYINCTLMSIYMGLVSGIETLCANAYATKKYKLLGYYYQRARIISYAVTIVLVIIHFFTAQHVLRLFNLNNKVITYSSHYIYSCLIYVFFDVQTACIFRMLNVMDKSHINFFILLISLGLHPLWNYIFISVLDYGVVGAGISFTISKFIAFVLSTIYFWFWHPVPESNFWINKKCFGIKGIINYLKFSLGSAFLTCAEWWGCELQAIIAIYLGEVDYTVYILVAELSGLLYSLDVGFMLSITILVGEIIAKGSIKQVKLSCIYSILFGIFCNTIYLGIFCIFRKQIFNIFTQEENIRELGYSVCLILTFSEFFDLIQTCLVAIFRGIGRQYTASILMFAHYYIVMIGLSIVFGIVLKLGVSGMFIGIGISDCIMSVGYLITLCCIDYKKAQKETIERLRRDNILTHVVGDEEEGFVSVEEEKEENDEKQENEENKEKEKTEYVGSVAKDKEENKEKVEENKEKEEDNIVIVTEEKGQDNNGENENENI